eukprot:441345-Hanusia_phi.AAC.3
MPPMRFSDAMALEALGRQISTREIERRTEEEQERAGRLRGRGGEEVWRAGRRERREEEGGRGRCGGGKITLRRRSRSGRVSCLTTVEVMERNVGPDHGAISLRLSEGGGDLSTHSSSLIKVMERDVRPCDFLPGVNVHNVLAWHKGGTRVRLRASEQGRALCVGTGLVLRSSSGSKALLVANNVSMLLLQDLGSFHCIRKPAGQVTASNGKTEAKPLHLPRRKTRLPLHAPPGREHEWSHPSAHHYHCRHHHRGNHEHRHRQPRRHGITAPSHHGAIKCYEPLQYLLAGAARRATGPGAARAAARGRPGGPPALST